MGRLLALTPIVAVVIAITACGGGGDTPSTFGPLPTPTTPPDFVTFTDESILFSIGHPPDWELALSFVTDLEERVNDLIRTRQSDLPLASEGFLFYAGLPVESAYLPNVIISVESFPEDLTVAEFNETTQRILEALLPGLIVHSQTNLLIGTREAILKDAEFDASVFQPDATGKVRNISLGIVDGRVAWDVTCTVSINSPASAEDLQTCNAVVRSFRILQ